MILKAIHLLQKRAVCIIFNENNMAHWWPLLRPLNPSNVYQINLFEHLRFMYSFNKNKTPIIFNSLIKKPFHKDPIKFSKNSFSFKTFKRSSSVLRLMYKFNKNETSIIFNSLIKNLFRSIQQNFQKTVLASKRSSSMFRNIVFLSEDPKFGMIS